MKYLALTATAFMLLAPNIASAEYLCEKLWNKKYAASCPAGSAWDSASATCVIVSG